MLKTRQKRHSPLRYLVMPVVAALSLSYFYYHAMVGHYGLRSSESLDLRQAELRVELAQLQSFKDKQRLRVELLQDGSIESDMIDERARAILGMTSSRDVVILN